MKIVFRFSIIVALFVTSTLMAAPNTTQQLAALLSNFSAMSANFQQTQYDANGNIIQHSGGSMALQRPGKFRWQINNPNKQIMIANNRYLWIYDVDLEQATCQAFDKNNINSPASLLSGSVEELQQRFNVVSLPKKVGQGFKLTPRSKNDIFKWIELNFVNNHLADMQLLDNLGQRSVFKFSNVQMNPVLPIGLFIFKAPRGVDIIQNS